MGMEGELERNELKFDIKVATIEDVEKILELNKKLFDYEIQQGFDKNLDSSWSETEEAAEEIRDRVSSEESRGFVVRGGQEAVGYLIGLIQEEETGRAESKYAEIEHMFVDEDFRSRGVGASLVNNFKEWAKEQGIRKIKVNVSFENKEAVRFYEKLGLVPADVTLVMDVE